MLLAQDYAVSPDGRTYTFTLRSGVRFHSGKPLTAADVESSFERVRSESSQFARKESYKVVETVDVPDGRTVVFHLSDRSIPFSYLLSYVWIINPDLGDPKNGADGTGPYKFQAWRRGSTWSIVRNEDYWGERPKNGGATFHYFTDSSAQTNALLSKQVDLIVNIQSADARALFHKRAGFTITEGTSTTKELLAFNDRVAPFDNVLVRRSIYSAIDREKLLDAVWGGRGKVIGSMVPPTDPWFEDLVPLNPYDPALWKRLLAQAKLPNGFVFTLLTPSYDPHTVVAEFIKSELAKIVVTVNITVITADEWYSKVFQERNFEATLQEHVNDRDVVWYGNPDFYSGFDNPAVQTLVKQAESAASVQEQTYLLMKANRIIAGEAASASMLTTAIAQHDYPSIQGVLVVTTFLVLLIGFPADITQRVLDPRLRSSPIGGRP